jgi:hypothetical protein
MSLPQQRPGAGLTKRRTGPGRCSAEQVVQAAAGDHEQAVGGARAGDGQLPEGGVAIAPLPTAAPLPVKATRP